jgi:hypothetical protein
MKGGQSYRKCRSLSTVRPHYRSKILNDNVNITKRTTFIKFLKYPASRGLDCKASNPFKPIRVTPKTELLFHYIGSCRAKLNT